MRNLAFCTVFLGIIALSSAKVTLEIYESDGVTLFDNRKITVGTELKLIVSSDSNDLWSGGVFLDGESRELGSLFGSGYDPNTRDWTDCHLSDSGSEPYVYAWEDSLIQGFDLFTSPEDDAAPGDWFVIDYVALEPGEPNVGFYEHSVSWNEPNEFVFLRQVPPADFNTDGVVNFLDYSLLASCWLEEDCTNPNGCQKADIDTNGVVDANDLFIFADNWLWGIPEPNQVDPISDPDPNLIYSVVDANGFAEISMTVGDSITLYVDMNSIDANDSIWSFDIEVNISNPNLGSIDNTAYDPNDPPGDGTARILAGPNRWELFDYWCPGEQQQEGILLRGGGASGAFEEGHFASFVYTSEAAGDVVLSLINRSTTSTSAEKLYPTLESIVIHQSEMLGGESMMSSMSMESMATTDSMETVEQTVPSMSPEEMVEFLEDAWEQSSTLQESVDDKVWKEFIKDVGQSD